MGNSKAQQESRGGTEEDAIDHKPTLRDWLTLLQTNHDESIDDQVKNIDAVEAAIQSLLAEARKGAEYQIGIRICNEKLGIWGLSIAKEGRTVYSDIYQTEQAAKDSVPAVLAELAALGGKSDE